MSFWSSQKIEEKQRALSVISPDLFKTENIQHGAYELTLGSEVFTTKFSEKSVIGNGGHTSIPPGQFALLITNEIVKIPADTIGFISIKAGSKLRGLVNVSGFHVDPGYNGRLKFGVYNAGPTNIVLWQGQRIFLIWFSTLDGETRDPYPPSKRTDEEKNTITGNDVMRLQGEIASPAALDAKIKDINDKLTQRMEKIEDWFKIGWKLFVAVLLTIIGIYLKNWMDKPCSNAFLSPAAQSAPMAMPAKMVAETNESGSDVSRNHVSQSATTPEKTIPKNK